MGHTVPVGVYVGSLKIWHVMQCLCVWHIINTPDINFTTPTQPSTLYGMIQEIWAKLTRCAKAYSISSSVSIVSKIAYDLDSEHRDHNTHRP